MAVVLKKTVPTLVRRNVPVTPQYVIPTKPKTAVTDINQYVFMIYAREGFGKTTGFATWPDSMFFSFEPGTKALEIREFFSQNNVQPSWEAFRAAVAMLIKIPVEERTVKSLILDTGDKAYDCCMDWFCKDRKIPYPGEDSDGDEDWGKSWKELKKEFTEQICMASNAGYGIGITSHSKTSTINSASGSKYEIITPTMGGQAFSVMRAITDFIFYGEYVKDSSGNPVRVLITEGDELVTAKHHERQGIRMPKYLPFPAPWENETPYEVISKAFNGQHPGLDPSTFQTSKLTSVAGVKQVLSTKAASLKTVVKKVGQA